jgi:hypothetical protein
VEGFAASSMIFVYAVVLIAAVALTIYTIVWLCKVTMQVYRVRYRKSGPVPFPSWITDLEEEEPVMVPMDALPDDELQRICQHYRDTRVDRKFRKRVGSPIITLLYKAALFGLSKEEYAAVTDEAAKALEQMLQASGCLSKQDFDGARERLERALRLTRQIYGAGKHWLEPVIMYDLALVIHKLGDNAAAAQTLYEARWLVRTLDTSKYQFLQLVTIGPHPMGMGSRLPKRKEE